jgi:DNA-binding NtrC family response regulator
LLLETPFDAIITDFRMPELSGKELFDEAKVRRPGIEKRFLFISGEMDPEAKTEFIRESGVRVIAKPFKADLVREAIRNVLDAVD